MIYLRGTSQNGGGTQVKTFKFIEEVHHCPAIWDVSSLVYNDGKRKQRKMKELADKPGFVQTFLLLHRLLFLLFFSSVSLFYVSATAITYVGHVANHRVL